MATGKVKWFNATKGYGFIEASGQKDVFVHISAVERAGATTLNEGQTVDYELVAGRSGKSPAENLKLRSTDGVARKCDRRCGRSLPVKQAPGHTR